MTDTKQPKFSKDEYVKMLAAEGLSNAYVTAAVNDYRKALALPEVKAVSEADLTMSEMMTVVRLSTVPRQHTPQQIEGVLRRTQLPAEIADERLVAYCHAYKLSMPAGTGVLGWTRSLIELEAALCGYTTLNNIPTTLIRNQMKRPYPPAAYKARGSAFGSIDVLDPKCVRLRLNEVFGAPGIGWRIGGEQNLSMAHAESYEEPLSKGGSRAMVQVRTFGFFGEYAVRDVLAGSIFYVRTPVIFDGWHMPDFESAGSGAATALVKEFARVMGGMDESESEIELIVNDD